MSRSGGGGYDSSVANFIGKLWKIVENPENNKYISWTDDGKTVVVKDEVAFARNILPRYFKHNKLNSFVRQLNLYGFHKVSSPDQGSLVSIGNEPSHFWHANFRRGHPEDLHLVQRKMPGKSGGVGGEVGVRESFLQRDTPQRLTDVMSDIHQMKGRQEGIAAVLDALKQDNTHLRQEVAVLKDKHIRQQKILNKIIHFLVHMVYTKGKIPPATTTRRPTRNNQLMLMESELQTPLAKKIRVDDAGLDDYAIASQSNLLLDPLSPPDIVTLSPQSARSTLSPQSIPSVSDHASMAAVTTPVSNNSMTLPTPESSMAQATPTSTSSVSNMEMALQPFTSHPLVSLGSIPLTVTSGPTTTSAGQVPALSEPFPLPAGSKSSSLGPLSLQSLPQSLSSDPSTLTSTVLVSSNDFPIPASVLNEYPIPAAPTSLVPAPHPENRMCLNGQLKHQELGLQNLQDMISGNFNLDPSVISEFMTSDSNYPEYDFTDTAHILENLPSLSEMNLPPESLEKIQAALPVVDDTDDSGKQDSQGVESQNLLLTEDLLNNPYNI